MRDAGAGTPVTGALVDAPAPVPDEADALRAADVTGALLHASMVGAQVRAAGALLDAPGADELAGARPRALVWVSGRSERAREAAALVVAVAEQLGDPHVPPIVPARVVPRWLGALDVVVVSGDDPGDPEAVRAVDTAVRRGATVVLDLPVEGPVREAAGGRGIEVPELPLVPPHRGLARHVGTGLAVLTAFGARGMDPRELADVVDAELAGDAPEVAGPVNPAKLLAEQVAGDDPVVFVHDDAVAAALAARAVAALGEAGRPSLAQSVADAVRSRADRQATHPQPELDPDLALFHDPELDGPLEGARPTRYLGMVCASRPETVELAAAPLGHVDWITRLPPVLDDTPGTPGAGEAVALMARVDMAAAYRMVAGR